MWLRMTRIVFVWLSAGIGLLGGVDAPAAEQKGGGEGGLELTVHVCQANNNSPYTLSNGRQPARRRRPGITEAWREACRTAPWG